MAKKSSSSKIGWYVFFTLAFGLLIVMSLAASIRLTQIQQETRGYAKELPNQ